MQSENFNLDDLFREKEAETKASLRLREEGKQRLFDRMHTAPMRAPSGRSFTVFYQAAAVLIFVMVAVYFATDFTKKEKAISVVYPGENLHPKSKADEQSLSQEKTTKSTYKYSNAVPAKNKNQVNALPLTKNQFVLPPQLVTNENKNSVPLVANNPPVRSALAAQQVMRSFFASLEKPPQEFIIEAARDFTVAADEGTKIFIPANTFVEAGGKPIIGQIEFRLIECYTLDQITAHQLSTTSNGEMLETAGMLYMHASSNGREVFIADGAAIEVSMPAKNFNPRMQLFYGDENDRTSIPVTTYNYNGSTFKNVTTSEINLEGKDFAYRPSPDNWAAAGQEQREWTSKRKTVRVINYIDNPVTVKDVKGKMVAHYIISPACDLTIDQVKKELEKRYLSRYDEILVTRESKFKKQISTNPFQPSVYVGDSVNMPMTMAMHLKLITRADSARLEQEWLRELEVIEENKKAMAEMVKMREQYNFRITKMGWINCDRFLNLSRNQVIEYTVKPGIQFDNNVCYSTMIFHRTKSILEGSMKNGEIKYDRLPLDAPVTLLCIGVKDGVTYVATKDVKVDNRPPELDFKVMAPDEFKALLAKFILN